MAKELPYFKFEPSEWDNGNIQMCSLTSKGLFIDICGMYWSRLGDLPYALALQKLCKGDAKMMQELEKYEIYVVENENIHIKFLDEQLESFNVLSEIRRNAANARWNNANGMQKQSKRNAIREEKIREEKIKLTLMNRVAEFKNSLHPFVDEYGREMITEFFEYWTEHGPKDRKYRAEKEKSFSVERRLKTWAKNQKRFEKEKSPGKKEKLTATEMLRQKYGIEGN